MVSTQTPACDFGEQAPDFRLRGTDGNLWSLDQCRGPNGLLVMFICNHCPYVKAINHKLVREAAELRSLGIYCVGIMSNDTLQYPEDSYEKMQETSAKLGYNFPYLFDETQEVARAYGAVCTPDFFGFNGNLELQYRGRLDASGMQAGSAEDKRELFLAMQQVAQTGHGPENQIPSIGCSIKWRDS